MLSLKLPLPRVAPLVRNASALSGGHPLVLYNAVANIHNTSHQDGNCIRPMLVVF